MPIRGLRRVGSALLPLTLLAMAAAGIARADDAPGPEPATLNLWNRPIATFRATVGGVPPAQRVRNSAARIAALPLGGGDWKIEALPGRLDTHAGLVLAVDDRVVFGLVPGDLDPESEATLEQEAARSAKQLRELLLAREAQRDVPALLRGVALSLVALLVLLAAVWIVFRVRNAAVGWLAKLFRNKRFSIAGIDILPTIETVERATFRVLSWAAILALAYLCLTFVFQQFPYTAPLGQLLGDYLVAHLAIAAKTVARALPSLLGVVAVLMITRAISLWVARVLVEVEHGLRKVSWLAQEQAKATRRIASGVVWMLGIATAYPLLPWSNSLAFQGISVLVGLAVSFASGGLINHWVSGLMVLYARSYRVGEFVAIGETEGVVTEMGALATKLRTMRREEITIPNGAMATEKLVNYTRLAADKGMLLSISLAVGYDVPWQRVRALLLDAASGAAGVAADPPPRVLPWELTDFFVRYQLHAYLEPGADRIAVRAELNSRILDAFAAAGIQIMVPHFESQPDRPVVPRVVGAPA